MNLPSRSSRRVPQALRALLLFALPACADGPGGAGDAPALAAGALSLLADGAGCPAGTRPADLPAGAGWRCELPDGTAHGPFELRWPSGLPRMRGWHEQGERTGPFETWWEDGSAQQRGTLRAGELVGPTRLRLPDGGEWIEWTPGGEAAWSAAEPPAPQGAGREPEQAVRVDRGDGALGAAAVEAAGRLRALARERGAVRVLVGLAQPFEPEGELEAWEAEAQRGRIAGHGRRLVDALRRTATRAYATYETVPWIALEADAAGVAALVADPGVAAIEEDVALPPALAESAPLVAANALWAGGFDGAGWAVAVLDTGVDGTHPFLAGKVFSEACYSTTQAGSESLCPGGVSSSTDAGSGAPCPASLPGCDHGTHVAGIAAGRNDTYSGVARGAQVMAVKVFSKMTTSSGCSGNTPPCISALTSDLLRGLERVYALRDSASPRLAAVNLSLGGGQYSSYCDTHSLKPIIDNLRSAAIATVIATGNNGYTGYVAAPSCISTSVSVGATTKTDAVATYSNHASILSLLAPGSSITSSVPGTGYAAKDGTSMATPHVAGAFALLRQAQPTRSVTQLTTALQSTGLAVTRSGITRPRIRLDAALSTWTTEPPAFNPAPGAFEGPVTVTATSGSPGASLRYTLDGSQPSETHGTPLANGGTVTIPTTATLQAVACAAGLPCSLATAGLYAITGSLRVNLEPPAAVAAGARWRVAAGYDGFETNTLTRLPWTATGNAAWATTGSSPAVGTYAARSGVIGHSQSSGLALTASGPAGEVRFRSRTSSEANYDFLRFYVDDVQRGSWSGETAWTERVYTVTAGSHRYRWEYTKDGSVVRGEDAAFVDEVILPSGGWRASGDTASGLAGTVTVEFLPLTDWAEPAPTPVEIPSGATITHTGVYTLPTGSLQVTLEPAGARDAGGRWRVDGGAWQTSGTRLDGVRAGGRTVDFLDLTDWAAPAARTVNVPRGGLGTDTGTYVQRQAAAPTLSPAPGTYTTAQSVTLATATPGAVVRYTLDGTDPTASSPLYTAPIALGLDTTTTVRARAFRAGWLDSAAAGGTYVITGTVATPTFSPAPGTYRTATTVTIATTTPGATIRYTVDGTDPTTSSFIYTGPITFSLSGTTRTLKARAFRTGWTESAVAAGVYTITGTVPPPSFNPGGNTYTSSPSVVITCPDPQATLRYTLDGSDPTESSAAYTAPVAMPLDATTVLKARGFRADWDPSIIAMGTYVVTGTVATPTFAPAAGLYTTAQTVALSTATANATIRYTLDGTEPNAGSTLYTQPIALGLRTTTTVRARAFRPAWADSAVATGLFRITDTVAAPTFDLAPGTYTTAKTLTASTTTPAATVRYTVDGSEPTEASPSWTGPLALPLDSVTHVKARAFLADWGPSPVAEGTWTVTGTVATPTFDPAPGLYKAARTLTMTTATAGATLRYTLDGSQPTASSPAYAAPLALPGDSTTTVRARAFKAQWLDSAVASGTWVVTGTVATPVPSLAAGLYTSERKLTLSTATANAAVRCTLDGSAPTQESPVCAQPISLGLDSTTVVRARAYRTDWVDSAELSGTWIVTGTVATPTFDLAPGLYTSARALTIATATADATVRYTLDGSEPTAASPAYTAPLDLALDTTTTLRARAFRPDWIDSEIAQGTWVITGTVAAPELSPAPGLYPTAQTLALSCGTAGATIHYTLDGSEPTAASPVYAEPLPLGLDSTVRVRALAVRADWVDSPPVDATYVITGTVAAPVPDVAPGLYTSEQLLRLSTPTANAIIRYTLDGSEPTAASPEHVEPIPLGLDSTTLVRARAFRPDWIDSAVLDAAYAITGTVATPELGLEPGTYPTAQTVALSCATPQAVVRYTLDGSEPGAASPAYDQPIALGLDSTTTLRARAFRADWADSAIAEGVYVITGTVATPTFDVAPGAYTTAQAVTAGSATALATVRCTVDGSEPTEQTPECPRPLAIPMGSDVTVRAKAWRPDWIPSETAEGRWMAYPPIELTDRAGVPLTGLTVRSGATAEVFAHGGSGSWETRATLRGTVVDGALRGTDGAFTFVGPQAGAFAGDYTLRFADPVTGWWRQIPTRVPLAVDVSAAALLGGDDAADVTVRGAPPGAVLALRLLDAQGGTPAGAAELDASSTTAADVPEQGNPAPARLVALDPPNDRQIWILATERTLQGTSDAVRISAATSLAGRVENMAGAPIAEASVATDGRLSRSTKTDAEGRFTLRAAATEVDDTSLDVEAARYRDGHAAAAPCATAPCTLVLEGVHASLAGTLRGMVAGETASLVATYPHADGTTRAAPGLAVAARGTGADAYAMSLDSMLPYDALTVRARGYLEARSAPAGGFALDAGDLAGVDFTLEPTTPEVTTGEATERDDRIVLAARVRPNERRTSVVFEVTGPTGATTTTPPAEADAGAEQDVATALGALECGEAYRYRAIATNDRGRTATGEERTFRSPPCPRVEGGCNCGSSPAGVAGLLALALLRRRRGSPAR